MPGSMALVVCLLSVVQVPQDVRNRTLSRRATLCAFLVLLAIACVDSLTGASFVNLGIASVASALLGVAFLLLHRRSSASLGLGDVLLVIPLGFALAYHRLADVLTWQLISTTSAACHALVVRIRFRQSSIAFGPHLLVAAVVVLIAGI